MPRTPRDFAVIDRLVLLGVTDQAIFDLLASPAWRSELALRGDRLACTRCDQTIEIRQCPECGLPDPLAPPAEFPGSGLG